MNTIHTNSQQGLTLVELLIALTIMSFLSVVIINHLITGMNSYQKVNEEISLHDEATYIIMQFERLILSAKQVEADDACEGPDNCLITVTNMDYESNEENFFTLGFKDKQAVIDNDPSKAVDFKIIHPERFKILDGSSILKDSTDGHHILITMIVEDTKCKYDTSITIEKRIPYVKVASD